MPDATNLGLKICQLRHSQGYTQKSFSHLIEMNRGYYGTIERGKANLTILNLGKIAKGLGLPVADLFLP